MAKLLRPPKANNGDSIDLKPLLGKPLAVMVTERRDVKTKFGERPVNTAIVVVAGQETPLHGVLFQSVFSKFTLGEWYAGVLEKEEMRWSLNPDKLNQKTVKDLEKQCSQIRIETAPEVL